MENNEKEEHEGHGLYRFLQKNMEINTMTRVL